MGLSVQTFREVSLTCDRIGCAAYYAAHWVQDVETALDRARSDGWWVRSPVAPGTENDVRPPATPLTFCDDHYPGRDVTFCDDGDPDGNASYCDYDDVWTEADRMGCNGE